MRRSLFVRLSCILIAVYLVYGYYLLCNLDPDVEFKKIEVENYEFSDSNSFRMDTFYKTSTYERVCKIAEGLVLFIIDHRFVIYYYYYF